VAEVNMSHMLEHISHLRVVATLERIHSWMQPDAKITVEVPDMREIAKIVDHPLWLYYVYGSQAFEGEYHRSGFTAQALHNALALAGFHDIEVRAFKSEHHYRKDMPCLEAVAFA